MLESPVCSCECQPSQLHPCLSSARPCRATPFKEKKTSFQELEKRLRQKIPSGHNTAQKSHPAPSCILFFIKNFRIRIIILRPHCTYTQFFNSQIRDQKYRDPDGLFLGSALFSAPRIGAFFSLLLSDHRRWSLCVITFRWDSSLSQME